MTPSRFMSLVPAGVDYASLRTVEEEAETAQVRRGLLQPIRRATDRGGMVTVQVGAGLGYAATPDLSDAGVRAALGRAREIAAASAGVAVFDARSVPRRRQSGMYASPIRRHWEGFGLPERVELLHRIAAQMKISDRIVDWEAYLSVTDSESWFWDTEGSEITQSSLYVAPDLLVTAHAGGQTQRRSNGLRGNCRQGGVEVLDEVGFTTEARRLAEEALELLDAPECPAGEMDLILDADQMMLQIHESIGHPLELDRILGDERNFAGTSFVTLDMFGTFQYGSDLLDVTFDPTVPGEFASYAYDDDATPADRQHLIRKGLLIRPLGGATSQARAGIAGVANARACSWNRPPIDRMANLNVEPGDTPLEGLIAGVERGVLMQTNRSWSIDDARNKFQFGCERATLIKDGRLDRVVRNPGYRGISSQFWRSLKGVGDRSTVQVLGTPFCGKGEPGQIIRVGHASPACLFGGVEVFGGEG